jgi:hypothetical protein
MSFIQLEGYSPRYVESSSKIVDEFVRALSNEGVNAGEISLDDISSDLTELFFSGKDRPAKITEFAQNYARLKRDPIQHSDPLWSASQQAKQTLHNR